jgi:hypothetical protein
VPSPKVVSGTRDAATVVLRDTPDNILRRISFYVVESRPIQKRLTDHERGFYLREIKRDIAYFSRSFGRANESVNVSDCSLEDAARRVREALKPTPLKDASEASEPARLAARV